ncbi:hypothetical protein [Desulfurococcus amylolyticus]|uniref:hypothetical protein n=1 Tax=Desulfurococcus amylolyticus TaxID=94694 RepID=UPI0023F3AFE3|nr:hypothetical protein [Desulfurococcus amylolyticus]
MRILFYRGAPLLYLYFLCLSGITRSSPLYLITLHLTTCSEGSDEKIIEFLKLFRDATQIVVNRIWSLDTIPSMKTLHKMFYKELRVYGFRAHHAKHVYSYARAIVKSARKRNSKKPILRKLTARIDRYDYKLDLESRTLILKLHNGYEARLSC